MTMKGDNTAKTQHQHMHNATHKGTRKMNACGSRRRNMDNVQRLAQRRTKKKRAEIAKGARAQRRVITRCKQIIAHLSTKELKWAQKHKSTLQQVQRGCKRERTGQAHEQGGNCKRRRQAKEREVMNVSNHPPHHMNGE